MECIRVKSISSNLFHNFWLRELKKSSQIYHMLADIKKKVLRTASEVAYFRYDTLASY